MRHFNSVNLIHLLLQLNAKPALGDSKPDRLQRLNRHAALLYDQASREAGQDFSTNSHYPDKEKNAISARVTAELMRANLTNPQQFNAVFAAIEDWQPRSKVPGCSQSLTQRLTESPAKTGIADDLPGLQGTFERRHRERIERQTSAGIRTIYR